MIRYPITLLVLLSLALSSSASERQILIRDSFAQPRAKEREHKPVRARFIEPDFDVLALRGELAGKRSIRFKAVLRKLVEVEG